MPPHYQSSRAGETRWGGLLCFTGPTGPTLVRYGWRKGGTEGVRGSGGLTKRKGQDKGKWVTTGDWAVLLLRSTVVQGSM